VSALPHISGLFVSQGGVPKTAIPAGIIGPTGLLTDKVKHIKIHGGPERALCLFSADRLHALQAEGHPIQPGWVGENILIANLNWSTLDIGHVLHLGSSVQVQVTDHTEPCNQIASAFINCDFRRIKHALHPGWSRLYVRVLAEGTVKVGDQVTVD
jgi:MOSC domain-containing protein YiiM